MIPPTVKHAIVCRSPERERHVRMRLALSEGDAVLVDIPLPTLHRMTNELVDAEFAARVPGDVAAS